MQNSSIDEAPIKPREAQMGSNIIQTKPTVIQLPISLYAGKLYVVESELQLPRDYQPAVGSFFIHDVLPGRLSVHWWGFDARDQKIYLCLSVGYSDSTRTISEWLIEHTGWHLASDPLVILSSGEDDDIGDFPDQDLEY